MDQNEDQRVRTNKINHRIRHPKRIRRFHAPTQMQNVRLQLPLATLRTPIHLPTSTHLPLQLPEILPRQPIKTRRNRLSHQLLRPLHLPLLGYLDLQLTPPEPQIQNLLYATRGGRRFLGLILQNAIAARDPEGAFAAADEGRDVRGGEEDEGDRGVVREGDVGAVATVELNV